MASATRYFLLAALILISLTTPVFAAETATKQPPHPPIAVHFHLDRPGFVTLVVEDQNGMRVRNLVSETSFPAGDNIEWWDGLDDRERDPDSAAHAVYYIPGKLVSPGTYTVRGLYRQRIDLKYEFAIYNPGQPPWMTSDTSSEWLTNHTPPSAVCFIPAGRVPVHGQRDAGAPAQVLIGSYVAEGGSGLAWVNLDGQKLHGQMWVGGDWTGAQQIARDLGSNPQPGVYAYVASSWKGELRLHELVNDQQRKVKPPQNPRLGNGEDSPVLNPAWKFSRPDLDGIGGLAAHNGLVIVSLPKMDSLLLIDAALSRVVGTLPVPQPGGLYADNGGLLYIISGKRILKATLPGKTNTGDEPPKLGNPQVFIAEGLEQPQQMTMDAAQNLYVSDWGASNQVKVFSPSGKILRSIGMAGIVASGPYDPQLMHHPEGITIDSRDQLWVAEVDYQPKRVSVWSLDGRVLRAFYGPPAYGGGGNLDPRDKSLFYLNGMTFRLNWTTGESTLIAIQHRPKEGELQFVPSFSDPGANQPFQETGGQYKGAGASENPDFPIYFAGRKYWTNAYNTHPTSGTPLAGIWINKDGVAVPVAAFGRADSRQVFLSAAFRSHIPIPASPRNDHDEPLDLSGYTFAWSDLNGDGVVEPEEITLAPGIVHSVAVLPNLELVTDTAISYKPSTFTAGGAPVYGLNKSKIPGLQTQKPTSTGGGQVLTTSSDWTVLTTGPKPFASESIAGAEHGVAKWTYPSLWPGLHASHISPLPEFPGELIGTTRVLGPSFQLRKAKDVELWAINGNKGTIYLFTTDGLFVATLFRDSRLPTASWAQRSKAIRGMSVSDLTTGEENFWPSITQTEDGQVYVVTNFPAIIRVDGLATIRRLAPQTFRVDANALEQARAFFLSAELSRRRAVRESELIVPVGTLPLKLDGDLSTWDPKQFVTIDERSKQVGDWGRIKIQTLAAMRVAGDRLYAAFRTHDSNALENSGVSPQNLFKTGGALDLMLATDPNSDPKRKSGAPRDIRLVVSLVRGKPIAVLYRPVAMSGPKNSALFQSPLRTLKFDDVEDVSQYVQLVKNTNESSGNGAEAGDFEFSIPVQILGLKPLPGTAVRGDIGLLRGDGLRTTQRVYWSNKAAGLVSDLPSETELMPQLWGTMKFVVDSSDQR
jgi:hypothetical protein